jgi:hypothetical protein
MKRSSLRAATVVPVALDFSVLAVPAHFVIHHKVHLVCLCAETFADGNIVVDVCLDNSEVNPFASFVNQRSANLTMQPTCGTAMVLVVVSRHVAVDGLDVSVLQKFDVCFIHCFEGFYLSANLITFPPLHFR